MKIRKDLNKLAKENDAFRKVLETGSHAQIVLMSLRKGESIGAEVHSGTDQIFYVVEGKAEVVMSGTPDMVEKNEAVFVPAGVRHDVRNAGVEPLKLFTIYAPPMHAKTLVQKTREEAMAAHH